MKKVSRRTFAKVAGAVAIASTTKLPALGSEAVQAQGDALRSFPQGFIWGTATASYPHAVVEERVRQNVWW